MDIKEINKRLAETGTSLESTYINENFEVVDASDPTNLEGLYKIVTVTLKNHKTGKTTKQLVWGQPLKVVTVPIVVNNADENYFLMVSQSRFTFGGKVAIEINKGFISETAHVDDKLLWHHLIGRKTPFLQDYADIVKVVDLGNYTQHPDYTTFQMPVQLVFAKTKENYDIAELKRSLKVRHDYYNEPKSGPPLHNTEPVLRSFDEVKTRLDQIIESPEVTVDEYYLNDVFSTTALQLTFQYIKSNGLPFDQ